MIEWDWPTYFLFGICLTFAFVCLHQYDSVKEKNYLHFLVLGLLPCFCIFAFRHEKVGMDLVRYAYKIYQARYGVDFFFANFLSGTILSEILSTFITFVAYYFGGINAFIVLTSLVQYVFIIILLNHLHKQRFNVSIFFLLFFSIILLRSCSMVKNGIAIVISYCAYVHLLDDKKEHKWFWFYTLLAVGFHNSALINIPVYFCCKPIEGSYWSTRRDILFRIITYIFTVLFVLLLQKSFFTDLTSSVSAGKYAHYEMTNVWGIGNVIIRLPLLGLFLFNLKGLKEKYGNRIVSLFYLLIFDIVISQTRYVYADLERLSQYFFFGQILFASLFYDYIKERVRFPFQFIYFAIVIICFTYYMYLWAIVSNYGLMPYKFMEW